MGKRLAPRKVSGKTRQEISEKLDALRAGPANGIRPSASYRVTMAVEDNLEQALPGLAVKTASAYRQALSPLEPLIGRDDRGRDGRTAL